MGGLRRRREGTIGGAYDFAGLTSVAEIQRLLEIATVDALALDNSVPRIRALIAVALAAAKLLETGELQEQLKVLNQAVLGQRAESPSPFDLELIPTPFIGDEGRTP